MSRYVRTIGIIGGLGPLAGAHFYRRLVDLSHAASDQEHPRVVLVSDPSLPSRLDHLRGRGPSPLPALIEVATRLVSAGAEVLALPSVTTHAYYEQLQAALPVPVVNALDAVTGALKGVGARSVALAVTTPARESGLLQGRLARAGVAVHTPGEREQTAIQDIVDSVKSGKKPELLAERLGCVLTGSWASAAGTRLIGCTDISPVAGHVRDLDFMDVADAYAEAVLAAASA
ncbi:amino acid racemase [Streptomyces sudanensis]|uniref:aspartate/glutamate racemase family protein n=1 Tax=Streptomyces sudanensis TaxID=436397 RepID=UPI0020CEBA65|nr:amino acid racemase [Streptomyces sudanensis]MCP9987615.1 amino acid racemase [Streptomyces sudanensis]